MADSINWGPFCGFLIIGGPYELGSRLRHLILGNFRIMVSWGAMSFDHRVDRRPLFCK